MKVLFVTWDGPQLSYLEGLFLPIFQRLADHGIRFHVLQFTWGPGGQPAQNACEMAGVSYQRIDVMRRIGAMGPMLSALSGAWHVSKAIRTHGIDVVMPRSTLPALACLLALRGKPTPMVFDADGLPLDERVDFAGQSPSGAIYRFLRDIEAHAVRRADVVLTRTLKAADILLARAGARTDPAKFHIVTNGRDANRFGPGDAATRHRVRAGLGLASATPLVVYAGSMGAQYCPDEMLTFFSRVRVLRTDAHLLVLTGSPEGLDAALVAHPDLLAAMTVLTVPADQVPDYLAAADVGLALRQPRFSMQAVAPIKLAEYLLSGLPVVATARVGDTAEFTAEFAYLVERLDAEAIDAAAAWFVDTVLVHRDEVRETARAFGAQRFSLNASVAQYAAALRRLVAAS